MLRVERFVGVVCIALSIACIAPIVSAKAQNAPTAPTPQAAAPLQGAPAWQMVPVSQPPNSSDQSVWLYNIQTGQT